VTHIIREIINTENKKNKELVMDLILIGGGGHAKVVYDAAVHSGFAVYGFVDENPKAPLTKHATYLGNLANLLNSAYLFAGDYVFICAIGDNEVRKKIVQDIEAKHPTVIWANIEDDRANVSEYSDIGPGTVVLCNASIQTDTRIGRHCIINTGAVVEHDCEVCDFVHVAPTTALCGGCQVGEGALIGVGAKLIPKVAVHNWATIGAGSVVLETVPDHVTVQNTWKKMPTLELQCPTQPYSPAWLARKPFDMLHIQSLLEPSIKRNQFANNGPAVQELEAYVRKLLGIHDTKALISVSNATAGIHAVVDAWRKPSGYHNIVTQAFSFPASMQGPLQNATLVDVSPFSGGPQIADIPPHPTVLVVTNVFGHLTKIDAYEKFVREEEKGNCKLLFDNAATPWSYFRGSNACNFGNASVISFHHTKPLGFGEGGMIIIDKEDEAMVRRIINFGYDVPRGDEVYMPTGNNYKMSDVSAAFILAHLQTHASRQRLAHCNIYTKFQALLEAHAPQVRYLYHWGAAPPFVSCLPVLFPFPVTLSFFQARKLYVRKYYKPLSGDRKRFPVAWDWYDRIICFPCHEEVTDHDLDRYLQACVDALNFFPLLSSESKSS
jgi:sugar O-acyltransferase (sialic acid O-acetyltransferase NeuD family)